MPSRGGSTNPDEDAAQPRDWDAREYNSLELPHVAWGRRVLDQLDCLDLPDGAVVMDAGAGTGRDVNQLLLRRPGFRVLAVDGSRAMLDQARINIDDPRVEYLHADLQHPLPLSHQVDAIISVATFHWVRDHATLFGNLLDNLHPGAHLIAECGGAGNLNGLNAAVAQVMGRPADGAWEFADDDQTTRHLIEAGFEVETVRLRPAPFSCASRATLERFLRTVILGAKVDRLSDEDAPAFVAEVANTMGTLDIDYVRLELRARRPL